MPGNPVTRPSAEVFLVRFGPGFGARTLTRTLASAFPVLWFRVREDFCGAFDMELTTSVWGEIRMSWGMGDSQIGMRRAGYSFFSVFACGGTSGFAQAHGR
jgi:hypothetical protein